MLKLDHYDIDVQVFEDGPAFFRSNRLRQRGDHFLILDEILPEMDGLEILEKVKQTKYLHKVLVMMLTGRNSKADIVRAIKLGADDYMAKPFYIDKLLSRMKKLLLRK